MTVPLLALDDLHIDVGGREAVRGVSFRMGRERLGIVGESGAGKSLLGRALLRLLPAGATMTARQLRFDGIDLLGLGDKGLKQLRGKRLALVLQDPRFALNPAIPAGEQIAEALRQHHRMPRRAARAAALRRLDAVQIRDPETVYRRYPHQLSGGMGQRVMIAMMLAGDPDLLIADEPTSALDASVAGGILALLDAEVRRRGMGIILISHDLDLVAAFCDRILVMQGGGIVEVCAAADLARARHPYTRALLAARRGLDA
ncbi:MAG: ATP-binding cassette domain-containing protein [Stellaceae bacterium]